MARQAAQEMQEAASRAQIARNKLRQAEVQARKIQIDILTSIEGGCMHPRPENEVKPQISYREIKRDDSDESELKKYVIKIGNTDGTGLIDVTTKTL